MPVLLWVMFEQLTSWPNLLQAYHQAAKGKRGQPNVATFEYHLEDNLLALQAELRSQTYRHGNYVSFLIHEPKRRLISAAPFRDRVVHHALCNLIEPIFERRFIADSYANRIGKGTHSALDCCQYFSRRYHYVLSCDIRQYFASIDHALLQAALYRHIADPKVRWLIDHILASGLGVQDESYEMVYFAGDDLLACLRPRGLPIGNLTSQFWANVYLDGFDHFVKRELGCRAYVRFVDDFLLWADDKAHLWRWREKIRVRLARFRLTIHAGSQPQPVEEGVGFLGFRVFPTKRRLKQRKGLYFQRRFTRYLAAYADGDLTREGLNATVQGWVNHVRYGNTIGLRKAVLSRRLIPKQDR